MHSAPQEKIDLINDIMDIIIQQKEDAEVLTCSADALKGFSTLDEEGVADLAHCLARNGIKTMQIGGTLLFYKIELRNEITFHHSVKTLKWQSNTLASRLKFILENAENEQIQAIQSCLNKQFTPELPENEVITIIAEMLEDQLPI